MTAPVPRLFAPFWDAAGTWAVARRIAGIYYPGEAHAPAATYSVHDETGAWWALQWSRTRNRWEATKRLRRRLVAR